MRRISKSKKKIVGAVACSVLVMSVGFGITFFVSRNQMQQEHEEQMMLLQNEIFSNQVTTYVAKEPIAAGQALTEQNTIMQDIFYQGGNSEPLITEDDFGKIVVADIPQGEAIYKTMVGTQLQDTLRETEYACFALSSNLKKYDFVDLRIMFPNGENYIVLSKVSLMKINHQTNNCILWLTEDQIMQISSAIVDAYMYQGTILYTTKYIEDSQKKTNANYVPTADCITAMANDENIVDKAKLSLNASVREALDTRLANKDIPTSGVDLTKLLPGNEEWSEDSENGENEDDVNKYSESQNTENDTVDDEAEGDSYGD